MERSVAGMGKRLLIALGAGLAAAAALLLLWVVYTFDPARGYPVPPCRFYAATGLLCPGCGGTRALHQLLHGNVAQAFYFNPLLVGAAPLGAAAALWMLARRLRRLPVLPGDWRLGVGAGFAAVAVLVVFWVVRNLPGWPLL